MEKTFEPGLQTLQHRDVAPIKHWTMSSSVLSLKVERPLKAALRACMSIV